MKNWQRKNVAIVAVAIFTVFLLSASASAAADADTFKISVDGEELSTDAMRVRVPFPPGSRFKISVKSAKNPKIYGNFSLFVDGMNKIRLDKASYSAALEIKSLKTGSWAIYAGLQKDKKILLLFDLDDEGEHLQFVKI